MIPSPFTLPAVETDKMTIYRLGQDGTTESEGVSVQYNPGELAFSKAATYADVAIPGLALPVSQFVRGEAETLSIELIFDGTERGMGRGTEGVEAAVQAVHALVLIDGDLHAPPLVRLVWGAHFPGGAQSTESKDRGVFDAQVMSVARRYTLFAPDGAPLRATVSLALKEWAPAHLQLQRLNLRSPDHTRVHVVAEGETLPLIAHDAYGDSARWRVIAAENGIDDARALVPGTKLSLPPITGRGAA